MRFLTSAQALAVLGMQPGASNDQVKSGWKKLALLHHPDRGGNLAKMQEINAAYDYLKKYYGGGSTNSSSYSYSDPWAAAAQKRQDARMAEEERLRSIFNNPHNRMRARCLAYFEFVLRRNPNATVTAMIQACAMHMNITNANAGYYWYRVFKKR